MKSFYISQKAIIVWQNKILILRRSKTAPSNPLKWDLPGGDLEYGENPSAGIIREIKEETGLEIEIAKPFDVEAHFNDKHEYWLTIAYKAETSTNKITISSEHDDYKWIQSSFIDKYKISSKISQFINLFNK